MTTNLKVKIADTVFLPQHLRDWPEDLEIKDCAYHIAFDILNLYYLGISTKFMTNRQIKKTCYGIDSLTYDLAQMSPPHINLLNWIWIGETIEKWIQFCVELEEYEAATNLRKLINSEYA